MQSRPLRILLVDDDEDDYILARDLLSDIRGREFNLDWVAAYDAALETIESNRHDVYLLDYRLGDRNGLELLREAVVNGCKAPMILLTGQGDHEVDLEAIKAGAADYLMKGQIDGPLLERSIRYAIERKRAEEALRESEECYALATRGANDGLWDWDLKDNQMYFSPRWKSMLGYEEDEIGNSPDEWFNRAHPEDIEQVRLDISAHVAELTAHFENEHRMLHKDGTYRWMLSRGIAVCDADGAVYRMAGSLTDVTDRKRAEEQLLHDAFHDVLTGLPNRALFMDRLGRAVERAKRREDHRFAVLFLDFDRFKVVNDSLGHTTGDQLLIAITPRLEACLRVADTVARLGGDEFTILLEDIKGVSDAIRLARRRHRDVSRQGAGQGTLRGVRHRHAGSRRGAPGAGDGPAAGGGSGGVSGSVPAHRITGKWPDHGIRGAGAVATSRAWPRVPGGVHSGGGRNGVDHNHRPVGAARGLPADAGMAGAIPRRPAAHDQREPIQQTVRATRFGRAGRTDSAGNGPGCAEFETGDHGECDHGRCRGRRRRARATESPGASGAHG